MFGITSPSQKSIIETVKIKTKTKSKAKSKEKRPRKGVRSSTAMSKKTASRMKSRSPGRTLESVQKYYDVPKVKCSCHHTCGREHRDDTPPPKGRQSPKQREERIQRSISRLSANRKGNCFYDLDDRYLNETQKQQKALRQARAEHRYMTSVLSGSEPTDSAAKNVKLSRKSNEILKNVQSMQRAQSQLSASISQNNISDNDVSDIPFQQGQPESPFLGRLSPENERIPLPYTPTVNISLMDPGENQGYHRNQTSMVNPMSDFLDQDLNQDFNPFYDSKEQQQQQQVKERSNTQLEPKPRKPRRTRDQRSPKSNNDSDNLIASTPSQSIQTNNLLTNLTIPIPNKDFVIPPMVTVSQLVPLHKQPKKIHRKQKYQRINFEYDHPYRR